MPIDQDEEETPSSHYRAGCCDSHKPLSASLYICIFALLFVSNRCFYALLLDGLPSRRKRARFDKGPRVAYSGPLCVFLTYMMIAAGEHDDRRKNRRIIGRNRQGTGDHAARGRGAPRASGKLGGGGAALRNGKRRYAAAFRQPRTSARPDRCGHGSLRWRLFLLFFRQIAHADQTRAAADGRNRAPL